MRETLAHALLARHFAIRWPDTLDERLAIAAELLPLAESLGDKELLLRAVHLSIANLLELGDIARRARSLPIGALTVMCAHGERAASAASLLEQAGRHDVAVVIGGPDDWAAAGATLDSGP